MTQTGSYPIIIQEGLVVNGGFSAPQTPANVGRWVLITDENLAKLYPDVIENLVTSWEDIIILPPGEETKTLGQVEVVLDKLAQRRLTRWDGLIAFGGGVSGDLTGFCASIYMRGINWIQIPTTLLGQVDSSVGGKTGVNLQSGKNLVGTFYPPQAVWIDPLFLKTLPDQEFWGGCSEVVKYALIQGDDFQQWLVHHWEAIGAKIPEIMAQLIKKCIVCKRDIVVKDEKEAGLRKTLNLGHTAGHAIEKLMNYQITHGEALRQGLLFELELARRLSLIHEVQHSQLASLVQMIPAMREIPGFSLENMVSAMALDKKNRQNTISFLLPHQSGKIEEVELNNKELINIMTNDGKR